MTDMDLRSYVEGKVSEGTRAPAIGVVTKVFEHDDPDDQSNHEANVRLVNNEEEPRRMPIHVSGPNESIVPQQGDPVVVGFLGSETQSPYVAGYIYTSDNRAPLARAGHWRRRFGPDGGPYLFLEAERSDHTAGDPDVLRMGKKSDGLSDPDTTVEIDDSGATTEVRVETTGDITLKADGDIVVDNGGTPKSVLTEDAVFQYEQRIDTDDGSGGTTTETTSTVSNGETTSSQID